jgi:hypothetical protein
MGCGSSFSVVPSIGNKSSNGTRNTLISKSGKLPPINSQQKINKEKDETDKNLEPFVLICLDEHFDENDKQLRSIIDRVYCFNDVDKCEDFIKEINQNNFIFFIVSNEYFTNIISHIHELSQIIAIYGFQEKKSNNSRKENTDKHWTKRYSKVNKRFFSSATTG